MKTLMTIGVLGMLSGFALADTVVENGGAPTFTNLPAESGLGVFTGVNTGTPYWDNLSSDKGGSGNACSGNCANIGDFLTATGSFTGGTNYNPNQYLSGPGSGTLPNNAPAAFNLVRNLNSLLITLLGVNTGAVDSFGIYDTANPANKTALFTTSTAIGTIVDQSAAPASYGFYVTNAGQTWYSNTALDTTDGTHQHFALFTTAADPNVLFLGVTDWLYGNGGTGNGDYQDLVIRIAAVPEPATFTLLGAGLLGLGFARFRSRKNRA